MLEMPTIIAIRKHRQRLENVQLPFTLRELQCFASRATRSHNSYAWRSVVFTYFAAATGHRKIPSFGKLMLLNAQDILACADGHSTLFA
jgi:hypothetical protein